MSATRRDADAKRVVTLLPSATEIVAALGCGDMLVGRSHECDYPDGVRALPACTRPKYPDDGTSYAIDQRIRALVQEGLAVYRVDGDLLRRLAPDLIVTQSQCDVCAASLEDVEAAVGAWTDHAAGIVSLEPRRLSDVWDDIDRVGAALGVPERAAALRADLEARVRAVADRVAGHGKPPRVACIEWLDPLMAAGNWMPELVRLAGGENLFGAPGRHSPWLEWRDLVAADPDVIVALPCGFDIARTLVELPALALRPGWSGLRAVRENRVFVCGGNQYFNRSGPRLAESLEILSEILHPGAAAYGHEGRGWQRVPG